MKFKILFFLTLIYSPIIFGKSAVINKIYLDRNEASAEFLADYRAYPKQHLIARFENGENCYLEIKKNWHWDLSQYSQISHHHLPDISMPPTGAQND